MAKILLIEDDEDIADNTILFLELRKHEVMHVCSGVDGLEQIRFGNFDLAIMDGNLPGMDGLEIAKTYRDEGGTTPILMSSGRSHAEDRQRGVEAGVSSYIVKPYSLSELESAINDLLALKSN